ncbi:MAG TPA: hemerythrin domain-containing protein [Kofleriaceae bacterium]|nr:hemerythrin domain-containing protein [Kofleriaceae bacterium]
MSIARREMLGVMLVGCAGAVKGAHAGGGGKEEGEEEVTPAEDLMREHGALERVLLIYEEAVRRIEQHEAFDAAVIASAADIVHRFVEGYHEKLEEDHLFPRFEKAGVLVDLVATLRAQHVAGREVTARIATLAPNPGADLVVQLRAFTRMYRPHHAREDTVLFAALPKVIDPRELKELGEQFEDEEHRRFGKAGFEGVVAEVAQLERALAIDDLARFTPT